MLPPDYLLEKVLFLRKISALRRNLGTDYQNYLFQRRLRWRDQRRRTKKELAASATAYRRDTKGGLNPYRPHLLLQASTSSPPLGLACGLIPRVRRSASEWRPEMPATAPTAALFGRVRHLRQKRGEKRAGGEGGRPRAPRIDRAKPEMSFQMRVHASEVDLTSS